VRSTRLIHKPDDKPVSDAVIFANRLDRAPEGMETMMCTKPGIYRLAAAVTTEGCWQSLLGAKVRGATGMVENKLFLKAMS